MKEDLKIWAWSFALIWVAGAILGSFLAAI